MTLQIKDTTKLSDKEILDLYKIHQIKYFNKGFGRSLAIWKEDLGLLYHNGLAKQMFLYLSEEESIEGYVISTKPIKNLHWSKLLETSVNSDNRNNKSILTSMVREIPSLEIVNDISYLIEINSIRKDMLDLYHSCGFEILNNQNLLSLLMSSFMPNGFDLKISEDKNGFLIERPTKLTETYKSYWLTYKKQ